MRDALFFSKLRVLLCGWQWKTHRRASWVKAQLRRVRHRLRSATTLRASRPPTGKIASPFYLESLEARVLLAADLSGVVQSVTALDPAVPTNNASAVVKVQNSGNQNVSQSQLGIYASLDNVLDGSDLLLGTANTGSVNAGASKNVTVSLTLPKTLNPVPYKLLAKVDNANAIAENSETNNVAIGGTINGTWKFGTVPGRTGNTTLTLKDADGTTVTFGVTGSGTGEVIRDGGSWDVKVTGTTASSAVIILTNGGGNGRVTLNDIHVFGPLSTFLAGTTELTGTLAIDGPVNISGVAPGTLTLGSIQGGTVAVPSVEALTILGTVTNAKFYIGTTFGQDGQPGGAGANTDTYGAGTIGLFTVTGAMTETSVRVGINPVDGIYGNGNDQLIGGTSSSIGGIVIGGTLSADTRFYSGAFPVKYLNGLTLKPTAGDVHFVSNFSGPSVSAALQQDTGASSSDGRTNNPAITGSVTDPQGVTTFTAGFGSSPTFNVLSDRQANGSFTFTRTRLEQINGGPLADGPYTLTLRATNGSGVTTQATVAFSLDTQVPTLTVALDPSSDTAPVGDQQTTHATVTLTGQTEALAVVELVGLGRTAMADASGTYSFGNVSLLAGAHAFTVRATDPAGNQRIATITITRLATNLPPLLNPIGNRTADEGTELRFAISASDPDVPAQPLVYGVTGLPDGATFDQGTREFAWTPTEEQAPETYTVTFSVTDGVATAVETIDIVVNEVNVAPLLAPIGNRVVNEGSELRFTISANDTDLPIQAVIYNASGVPEGATFNTATREFVWTPSESQGPGNYNVTFAVTDGFASDSETIVIEVVDANAAPALVPIGNKTVLEGNELHFTISGSDGDVPVQTLVYSATGLPQGAAFDPATQEFIWTPSALQGSSTYTVTFSVSDGLLSSSEAITITVTEVNQSPVLNAIGDHSATEGSLLTFQASVTDADVPAQVMTYALEDGIGGAVPAGASIDTSSGVFSWAPTEGQGPGTYTFDVVVTDNGSPALSDRETITVTVNEVNLAPGLSVPVAVSGDEQSLVTFTAVGTDGDLPANQLTFSLQETVPDGAVIDSVSGVFTWAPTEAQGPGVYDITVRVTDNGTPSAFIEQVVRLTIGDANQSPTITSASSVAVPENQTAIMTVTASDADIPAQSLTFSVIGGADAAAVAFTTGGALSFVTAPNFELRSDSDHDNVYDVTVQVSDGAGGIATQNVHVAVTNVVETVPTLSISDVTLAEGTSVSGTTAFNFAVTLSEPVNETVTVQVATSDNGATAASGDYTPVPPTTLTFGPGETTKPVMVQVRQDDRVEGNEQFQVSLSAPTDATILDGVGFGTILDDDVRSVSIDDVTVTEGDSGFNTATFTVTLSQASSGTVTVVATTAADSATPGSDYTTSSQTLTLAPGTTQQTFSVPIINDLLLESTEQFVVNLSSASAGIVIADAQGIGTILDNDANQAPVLTPIGNQTVNEGQLLQFSASATDPDSPTTVTYSLENGVGGQVPTGASIAAGTGLFTWTPTEAQGPGTFTFDVVVTDNGTPALSDRETITVTMNEVNQAPTLQTIPSQTVTAGQLLTFTAVGIDQDIPANGLTYSLQGVVPAGATIDSTTGVFSWTPTNAQLGLQSVTVRVTDGDAPFLFAEQIASITVNAQSNQAPVLAPIGNRTVSEGSQITFTTSATDADLPAQQLAFSLEGTIPAGATITPGGVFTWTPTGGQGGAHTLTVRVTDNGSPALFDEETFTITVGAELTLSFQGIGDLPGGVKFSDALGVSADGRVVVGGSSSAAGSEAVQWSEAGGLVILGGLPGGSALNFAYAASSDGTVVVGQADPTAGGGSDDGDAIRWTSSTGLVSLGSDTTGALDVSSDGTVIAGVGSRLGGSTAFGEAFRWTPSEGVVWLGALPGFIQSSEALGVSSDGQVVVGQSIAVGSLSGHAFRWDSVTGLVDLGDLPGGGDRSIAMDASLDGGVIVGTGSSANGFEAFRWAQSTGLVGLGDLVPGASASSDAMAVSDNGSVIVGRALGPNGYEAFVWDAVHGMRSLKQLLLADLGFTGISNNWQLTAATGVSADGLVVVGTGVNPLGQTEGWRAVLPTVTPENQAPVLNSIGDQNVNEGATLTFTGSATDSSPFQSLTYLLQGAVPDGAFIDANSGVFTWTPTEIQGPGTYSFDVVVRDNSATPLEDRETMTVTVNEVDENPVLNAIGNQSVNEDSLLTFTATATAALPSQTLTFSLQGIVPEGASINPTTGVFTWTPTEAQGPGTYQVTVRVADNGTLALFDEETISITISEVNQAPVLAPIADQAVAEGQTVTFSATATDPDVPTNQLTYSLEGTVPAGASIDPQTGLFTWTTSAGEVGSYSITVRVTDDGTPVLFSERTFNVTVLSNAASFQGLGDLPGGIVESHATGVSGNGAIVVGQSDSANGFEAFRWTAFGGMETVESVIGSPVTQIRAASFDGSVLVGDSAAGSFRWSLTDGLQTLIGNTAQHAANAVTGDGSVVVGKGQVNVFSTQGAFRWTVTTGTIRLDTLGGYADAEAFAVSADGNVIVGASYFGPSGEQEQAMRWVADGSGGFTVEALGDLPGGNFMSRALAVSADGAVILGISDSDLGQEAFIWTVSGGMRGLGDSTGDLRAMSAGGSVIVGGSNIWDANNGVRSLTQVLTDAGLSGFENWSSINAVGISADGRTIVGEGTNPDGNQEAWRVVLPVNAVAPIFNTVPVGGYQVQVGQNISFRISATDGDLNQSVQYRLLGNIPTSLIFTGVEFSWSPMIDDVGDHVFTIRAYDNGVPSRFTDVQFTITVTA